MSYTEKSTKKHIAVSTALHADLQQAGHSGETFEQILRKLLTGYRTDARTPEEIDLQERQERYDKFAEKINSIKSDCESLPDCQISIDIGARPVNPTAGKKGVSK